MKIFKTKAPKYCLKIHVSEKTAGYMYAAVASRRAFVEKNYPEQGDEITHLRKVERALFDLVTVRQKNDAPLPR